MLISAFSALLASVCYLLASRKIADKIRHYDNIDAEKQRQTIQRWAYFAIGLHIVSFSQTIWKDGNFVFNFANSLSMVALLSSAVLLMLDRRNSSETLGIFVFPFAALTTLLPVGFDQYVPMPLEIGSHVLISIAAYSILGVAAAQALLYSVQERRFRQRKLSALMRALPPLQVMESLMIQFVMIGFVLLTFALVSGAFFIEDIFAQHLVHKTFFAIVSWLVYFVFLVGHFKQGWRGQTAVRFSMWAYIMLILSFIGTEIALALIAR